MNPKELDVWKSEVSNHLEIVSTVVNDRRILKEHMEEHLKMFFDYTSIEFNKDMTVIQLYFDNNGWNEAGLISFSDDCELSELNMNWDVTVIGSHIIVRVYPWGFLNERQ